MESMRAPKMERKLSTNSGIEAGEEWEGGERNSNVRRQFCTKKMPVLTRPV